MTDGVWQRMVENSSMTTGRQQRMEYGLHDRSKNISTAAGIGRQLTRMVTRGCTYKTKEARCDAYPLRRFLVLMHIEP